MKLRWLPVIALAAFAFMVLPWWLLLVAPMWGLLFLIAVGLTFTVGLVVVRVLV